MKKDNITTNIHAAKARPLLAMALLFLAPAILGALLAPQAYRLLAWLGQYIDLGPHLTDPKFKRVMDRCVLITAILFLYPAIRMSGIRTLKQVGWERTPDRWKTIEIWFTVGTITMALLYLLSTWAGALYFRPRSTALTTVFSRITTTLIGAVFIGIFEETFFRGYLFGTFRTRFHFWTATGIASLIFALVHFARPAAPDTLNPVHWSAGFQMLPYLFNGIQNQYFWPTLTNLFLMGILLCMLYDHYGNIYATIGLHAGWVWMLGLGTYFFDRNGKTLWMLFGNSETLSMTWLGVLVLLGFIGAIGWMRRKKKMTGNKDSA